MSMMSMSSVYLVLRVRDEASRAIRGFTSTLTEADVAAAKIQAAQLRRGQAMSTIGAGIAIAGIVGIAVLDKMTNAAIAYNLQVANTQTQIDTTVSKGAIGFAQLSKMGTDAARALPVAFESIQPTLYDIFSSIDVNAPQAAALLMNIGKASVAGQADIQTVGKATIAILNAYKMKTSEVTTVNDVMFQLVRKGVGTYTDFTNVIGRVVPSATKAGQSLQTVTGMLAFMTRNGFSAANSVAPITQALNGLTKPAVIKSFEALGISVIDNTGHFKPLVDIVGELKKKLDPLPPAIQAIDLTNLFKGGGNSIASMKFWVNALKDTNGLLPEMVKNMNDAKGASAAAYAIEANTPAAKIILLRNAFKDLEVSVGQSTIPIKKDFVEALTVVVSWLGRLSPDTQRIAVLFIALASAAAIVIGIITALAGVIIILSSAMKIEAVAGIVAFTKSLAESAVLWVMYVGDAIGAMIAQFVLMSAAAISNLLRVTAAWIVMQLRTMAAAGIMDAGMLGMIARYVQLGLTAVATAVEISAAWIIALGPIGLVAAAVGAVTAAFYILDKEMSNNKKTWFDWAKIFVAGGPVGAAIEKLFGKHNLPGPTKAQIDATHTPDVQPHVFLTPAQQALADAKKSAADMMKMIDAILNPPKKPTAATSPIITAVGTAISTLKTLLKTGSTDITKYATEIPIALKQLGGGSTNALSSEITNVQKAIATLSAYTPNQLKAMGAASVQKLIDGLKSKEAALTLAYDDVLYKTMLKAQTKAQALADKGAVAIDAFIAKMTGNMGTNASTLNPSELLFGPSVIKAVPIALKLGSDVVDAFATGMASSDPKAKLAAYNALAASVETAYQDVLTQLDTAKQAIVDKMTAISDAISKGITDVISFSTVYTAALAVSKTASDALAVQNTVALKAVDATYQTGLTALNKTLTDAQTLLTNSADSITKGITDSLSFSNVASEANLQENSFLDQLKIDAAAAQTFAGQIKTLISMGLSGDSVTQIAALGATAGTTVAQSIIDGGATTISQTNDLVKSVTDVANSLGTTTADTFYKSGVTQAQAAVDGYVATMGPDSPGYLAMVKAGNDAVTAMASAIGDTFQTALASQNTLATGFAGQIKQLVAMGLNADSISQIVAMGQESGSKVAQSLIDGGVSTIKTTNDLITATTKMATDLGVNAANTFYGAGLADANALINAFTTNFGPKGVGRATLMTAMDDLANSMNRTATVTINTVNPGLLGGQTPSTGSGSGTTLSSSASVKSAISGLTGDAALAAANAAMDQQDAIAAQAAKDSADALAALKTLNATMATQAKQFAIRTS